MRLGTALTGVALATAVSIGAWAAAVKIKFPSYQSADFVRYTTVDKPERKPPIVRFLYMNKTAWDAAKPGEALPAHTILVMEDHKAKLDDSGAPAKSSDGRLIPTDELTGVFVQEKQPGWGADYPAELRNSTWEYAHFEPAGELKADAKYENCLTCHMKQAAEDFTFTAAKRVAEAKK